MLPMYTHWLKPEDFGSVDTMSTYSLFIIGFVCLCLPDALFIYPYNASEEKKKEYFSSGAIFSIITISTSAILFWAVQQVMLHMGLHNVFSDYTWLIFWMMVSAYVQNYCQTFTRSLNKMKHYSIAGIVLTFATALFSILLIPTLGIKGYAYSLMAAQFLAATYSFVATKSYRYCQVYGNSWSSVKEMLSYSVPLLPNGIMWWLVNGINRPVMEHFLGLAAIGIYAVANKFTGMLYSVLNIFSTAWGNSVLDEYGKPDFESFYNNYIRLLATLLFVGGYFVIIFSKFLVSILASEEYQDACLYVPPLIAGVIFSGLSGSVGAVFSATKESKYYFYSSVWGGVSSVVSLLLLTPTLGLMGTCLSVAISFFCMFISRLYYSSQFVRFTNSTFLVQLFVIYLIISLAELYCPQNIKILICVSCLVLTIFFCRKDIMLIIEKIKDRRSEKVL
jgi:O-antigen/teichoic acid export membrane protein